MSNRVIVLLGLVVLALSAWKFLSSETQSSIEPREQTQVDEQRQHRSPEVGLDESSDRPVAELDSNSGGEPSEVSARVIEEYKILPSEVGGVIALQLPNGEEFLSSFSKLQIVPCQDSPSAMCLAISQGRQIRVNKALKATLPAQAQFHIQHPMGPPAPAIGEAIPRQ